MFQASQYKGRNFLDLLDNEGQIISLLYTKGDAWVKYFGHLNTLYTKATRAITKHASIGEYCLCFFLKESFKCLCSEYLIETRYHILHHCIIYNKY